MKELVELRNKIKKKKPDFIRQDAHKKTKLSKNWRKPRGYHAKIRLSKAGKRKAVTTGYGSPKKVKGLTKEGLKSILLRSANLENIKEEGIIISSKIGTKKRLGILKKAKENNLKIINIKNIDQYIKAVEDKMAAKKETKKKREKAKKEKAEKVKPKKGKDLADKVSEEDKKLSSEDEKGLEKSKISQKEQEKKEKDKLLTKRDAN